MIFYVTNKQKAPVPTIFAHFNLTLYIDIKESIISYLSTYFNQIIFMAEQLQHKNEFLQKPWSMFFITFSTMIYKPKIEFINSHRRASHICDKGSNFQLTALWEIFMCLLLKHWTVCKSYQSVHPSSNIKMGTDFNLNGRWISQKPSYNVHLVHSGHIQKVVGHIFLHPRIGHNRAIMHTQKPDISAAYLCHRSHGQIAPFIWVSSETHQCKLGIFWWYHSWDETVQASHMTSQLVVLACEVHQDDLVQRLGVAERKQGHAEQ